MGIGNWKFERKGKILDFIPDIYGSVMVMLLEVCSMLLGVSLEILSSAILAVNSILSVLSLI